MKTILGSDHEKIITLLRKIAWGNCHEDADARDAAEEALRLLGDPLEQRPGDIRAKPMDLRQMILDAWLAGSSAKVPDGKYGDAAHAYATSVCAVAESMSVAFPLDRLPGDDSQDFSWPPIPAGKERVMMPAPLYMQARTAVNCVKAITRLRGAAGCGHSVTILCDNEEGDPACAVEVTADWTGWKPARFGGKDFFDALARADYARHEHHAAGKAQANPLLPWYIRDAEWMPKVSDAQQAAEMQLYSVPLFGEVKPGPVKLALMCQLPGLTIMGYLTATEAPMFRSVQVSPGEKAGGFDPLPPCNKEPQARIDTALINGEEIVFPLWRKEGIRGLVYATHVRVFMPPMQGYKDIVLPKPILMNNELNAVLAPGTIRL